MPQIEIATSNTQAQQNAQGRTLIIDGSSGISGDMTVAALLDLGASEERLRAALATLPVDGFGIAITRVTKNGLAACDFDVRLDAEHENHDHDMAWLFGTNDSKQEHAYDHHDRVSEHNHAHTHEHNHIHESGHAHGHRSLAEISALINGSHMTEAAKTRALAIFAKLTEAEAKAHGATPETVLLHEVGALDSIVDICAVAICLEDLGIENIVVESLAEGHGTIRCAHGVMPIPVPAVVNLCQAAHIELAPAPVHGELVTPTGAAIVAALRTSTQLPTHYAIEAVGYGAGKRTYENCSGTLRALLVTATAPSENLPGTSCPAAERMGSVVKLETDLDDCTGEALGRTIELLMAAGAREAHAIPIVMKKGRPAYQLEVICDHSNEEELRSIIFANTTTIGIRSMEMRRHPLPREAAEVPTRFGTVAVKRVVLSDGHTRAYPEYDSVVAVCEQSGASFQDVFRAAQAACEPTR